MTIHLYTICWNEAHLLGFFFRHYDSWVDRYVVFDDGSDDGSLDILKRHPKVEVRRFPRSPTGSFVQSQMDLQNSAWQESRGVADWVVVTAIDEHLELAGGGDQRAYLDACRRDGVTLVPAVGYQMVSWRFPPADWRLASRLTRASPFAEMNKLSIFDPGRITSPGFSPGRHYASPEGEVVYPDRDRMMILHYKHMGVLRTYRRQRELRRRLGKADLARKWGGHYTWGPVKYAYEWLRYERRARDIRAEGFDPTAPENHDPLIWWRMDSPL